MISAIVLAADVKRYRDIKSLPYGRYTIVEEVVGNLLNSNVDEIILVLGSRIAEIKKRFEGKRVKIVINPGYNQGLSASIKAGLQAMDKRTLAFLIALGDQPLVKGRVINKIISNYQESAKGIVIPVHRGVRGHPTLFDIKYKDETLRLSGDIGARGIVGEHHDDVLEVEVDTASIISDIEVDTDYLTQIRKFSLLDKE